MTRHFRHDPLDGDADERPVNVHNEWDPLEEIIVEVPDFARVPLPGPDLFAIEYVEHHDTFGSPDWRSDGEFNDCPRDVLLESYT